MKNNEQSNSPNALNDIRKSSSRNLLKRGRPIQLKLVYLIFLLVTIVLVFCFIYADYFTVNQITFLGIFGASALSFFTIFVTLYHEKRADYDRARQSANILAEIISSVETSTIYITDRLEKGHLDPIIYPHDWLRYYENCCSYLKYDYLTFLINEFDTINKVNNFIESKDIDQVKETLEWQRQQITDSSADYSIFEVELNLNAFANGLKESAPWHQDKEFKEFKQFMLENYSNEIRDLTIKLLNTKGGSCEAISARYYVMESLRKEKALQSGKYKDMAFQNRVLLQIIFDIYLSRKFDNDFTLCWGKLSLVNHNN